MPKKYEFTGETKRYQKVTLRRIRRLADGQIGGWIEDERNLSHSGNAWVGDEAMVFNTARVYDCARVKDYVIALDSVQIFNTAVVDGRVTLWNNVKVYGSATIHHDAVIRGNAQVYGRADVDGAAHIFGDAAIYDSAQVYGKAYVGEAAQIYGRVYVYGNANITGTAKVYGQATVCGDAMICGAVQITGPFDHIVVSGLPYPVTLLNNRTVSTAHTLLTFDEWRQLTIDPAEHVEDAKFIKMQELILPQIAVMDRWLRRGEPVPVVPVEHRRRVLR